MGLEKGCFCDEDMNLVIFVDATGPMIRKTNSGKVIISFLHNLVDRLNFNQTTLSIYFYGHQDLVYETETTLLAETDAAAVNSFIDLEL